MGIVRVKTGVSNRFLCNRSFGTGLFSVFFSALSSFLFVILFITLIGVLFTISPVFAGEIHTYAKAGDLEGVKKVLEKNPELINTQDENGKTPLHLATGWGKTEVVKYLLSKGANIEAQNKDGGTPMHVSASQNQPECTKILIENKGNVNAVRTNGGATPLHIASMKGSIEVAKLLIANGANVNAKMYNGATPLMIAVKMQNQSMIDLLKKSGAK